MLLQLELPSLSGKSQIVEGLDLLISLRYTANRIPGTYVKYFHSWNGYMTGIINIDPDAAAIAN